METQINTEKCKDGQTHLFSPWSFDELRIENFAPSLLALNIVSVRKMFRYNTPILAMNSNQID